MRIGASIRQTTVTVGTTSTQLVPERPERKYLMLINTGTVIAKLNFDAPAVSGSGVPLAAAPGAGQMGGVYSAESVVIPTSAINAVVAAGSTTITVLEGW